MTADSMVLIGQVLTYAARFHDVRLLAQVLCDQLTRVVKARERYMSSEQTTSSGLDGFYTPKALGNSVGMTRREISTQTEFKPTGRLNRYGGVYRCASRPHHRVEQMLKHFGWVLAATGVNSGCLDCRASRRYQPMEALPL
jgi:hypothetical protein